ncbi:hypothetical protein [Microcoleus sp. Pol14C4]
MNIIESILQQMSGVSQAQKKFMVTKAFHNYAGLWQSELHQSGQL